MNKILQYELWQECNNHCVYCTLGRENRLTPDSMKLEAIKKAIDDISKLTKGEVSTLGFIGGEFFQGQLDNWDVRNAFSDLIDLSNDLLNKGIIEELWLNATLTIGPSLDLYRVIRKIDKKDHLWILTSWDNDGRFHTDKMYSNWMQHLETLHSEYPEVRVNITSIITGSLIDEYLSGKFNISQFEKQHHAKLFLKTPVKPDDLCNCTKEEINKKFGYEFFPTETKFKQFLLAYLDREGETAYKNLFSNDLKASELHKNFNDDKLRDVVFTRTSDFSETLDCDESLKNIAQSVCGHSNIYKCFVDTDGCAICNKNLIQEL